MIKKKASAKKKKGKKGTWRKKSAKKKEMNPAKVREKIAGMVKDEAEDITEAVIDQAMHGALAQTKYLFEMAGVYPATSEGEQPGTEEEDGLAKFLSRLEPPRKVTEEEEEDEEPAVADKAADAGSDVEEENDTAGKLRVAVLV